MLSSASPGKSEERLAVRLESPKLVSSINGSIDRLLLTIPWWVFEANRYPEPDRKDIEKYAAVFRSILTTLPETTAFVVLTHSSSVAKFEQWVDEFSMSDRVEVVPAPDDMRFTVWAADAYTICVDEADSVQYFVEPVSFPRANDENIAELISKGTSLARSKSSIFFQGGNALIGDSFWLLGADDPAKSVKLGHVVSKPGETERDTIERAYAPLLDQHRTLYLIGSRFPVPEETRRKIIVRGEVWDEVLYFGNRPGSVQPLFHIDMFISLVGRRADNGKFRLLVADPGLAAQALGNPDWPFAMQEAFDDIAGRLEDLDFEVLRNPMPFAYYDDVENRKRSWYFATSNNVIVQDHPRIVWIPTYGHDSWISLRVTDEINKRLWETQGYEVRQLPDFHPIAAKYGGAHCIAKYLARGPAML
jgi:hypothetical protein